MPVATSITIELHFTLRSESGLITESLKERPIFFLIFQKAGSLATWIDLLAQHFFIFLLLNRHFTPFTN